MTNREQQVGRGRVVADLALLLLLGAVLYLPGLDTHGVTNWQEAQRLMVARDMQSRWQAGEGLRALLVPTINSEPYLAKPPLVYWAQLALAQPFGHRVELWHLRLAVALAGIAGIIATYACSWSLLRDRRAAIWAACFLATGILSTRSARIGELDVFLMPFCAGAIACVAQAWRAHRERRTTSMRWVLGAFFLTVLGVLTKDPAILVVGLAAYAGMALYYAWTSGPADVALIKARGSAPLEPLSTGNHSAGIRWALAAAAAIAGLAAAGSRIGNAEDVLGALLLAGGCAAIALTLVPVLAPRRFRALFVAMSRTHPLLVIAGAAALRIGYGWWVNALVGSDAAGAVAKVEAEDNLRLFVPEAPINNLEAAVYGVGVGSIVALIAIVWWFRQRPRLTPSTAILCTWIGLGLFAFSVLGKGVPRYLTPLWPALAIVAGLAIAESGRRQPVSPGRVRWQTWLAAVLTVMGGAQTAWYAIGREVLQPERTPRRAMAQIRPQLQPWEPKRFFSFEFATPANDYYLGQRVRALGNPGVNDTMAGGQPQRLEDLHRLLSNWENTQRTAIILVRDRARSSEVGTPVERLRQAGFRVEPLEMGEARFAIDSGRSSVIAVRVMVDRPNTDPARQDH